MSADPRQAALDAYFDGINGEHYDEVGELFTTEAVLRAPGFAPRHGRAAIAAYLAGVLTAYPVHHDQPTRTLLAGDTATVEIKFTGALANGAPLEFEAVDIFDFAPDGSIAALRTWYDSAAVLGDLAKAAALDPPGPGTADLGARAEATPARAKAALRAVRDGRAVHLSGTWLPGPGGEAGPLLARVLLLDLSGMTGTGDGDAELTVDASSIGTAAAAGGVDVRPGDALLIRTDAERIALGELPAGIAAVALDASLDSPPPGLPIGTGWDLSPAFAAIGPGRRPVGFLVAPLEGSGAVLVL